MICVLQVKPGVFKPSSYRYAFNNIGECLNTFYSIKHIILGWQFEASDVTLREMLSPQRHLGSFANFSDSYCWQLEFACRSLVWIGC